MNKGKLKKNFQPMTLEAWEHIGDIIYGECIICEKPTTNGYYTPLLGSIFCHDSCLEGLIKLNPKHFHKVTKNE